MKIFEKDLKFKNIAVLAILFSLAVGVVTPVQVGALTGSDFKAGRITDDNVFFRPGTMTTAEIQNFLNSKLPSCDTNGSKMYNATQTRAQYGQSKGNPAPYTCLKDYSQDTPSRTADAYCTKNYVGGTKSAAQIINDVSEACGLNPKVMIVLLQKEQSLITDDWPWNIQYRSATGYGCPDTAPCDEEYYGYFNQVYHAARQFQRYVKQSDFFNYQALDTAFVQYNPNSSCSGTNVYLETKATAALYNYTPYQPNQAALNNLYGSGDGCSAYGNRNFWRMFNDWFGSVYATPYFASYTSQSTYPTMSPGQTATIKLKYQNLGSKFWKDDSTSFPGAPPVRIATTNPINRTSNFYDSSWVSENRTTGLLSAVYESTGELSSDQHTVFPGQYGEYTFTVKTAAGLAPGTYREYFQVVAEGSSEWDAGGVVFQDITVKPLFQASYVSQTPYPTIKQSESKTVKFNYRNSGNMAWKDSTSVLPGENPVHLATSIPINRISPFYDNSWASINRPAKNFTAVYESDGVTLSSNQHIVQVGQIAQYAVQFTAGTDAKPQTYREFFQPVLEGAQEWQIGGHVFQDVTVLGTSLTAEYSQQSPYPTLSRGTTHELFLQFRNNGTATWRDDVSKTGFIAPMRIATTKPINRTSLFQHSEWVANNRPSGSLSAVFNADGTLSDNQHVVFPGQFGKYTFKINVPASAQPGTYNEHFQIIAEGANKWDLGGSTVLFLQIKVI